VKVNRDVKRFGAREDWPEKLIVQITASRAAVNDCSAEPEVTNSALSTRSAWF
jgi:hypothetical protein